MTEPELESFDGVGLAQLVKRGEVSALELVDETIRRIEALGDTVSPVSIPYFELARTEAQKPLPDGPLSGTPWLLKDLILLLEGTVTSNSMAFLEGAVADHDSVIVQRAKAGGLILVAKTKVPEYGFCISTEPKMFGPVRNPWDLGRVAGGSSGGSAAAVAARVVPYAHASDGGGSIRIPASWCGLVGLKVSRGHCSYAPDYADFWIGGAVEGCVSRSVRDTAAYADITLGPTIGDPYELQVSDVPFLKAIESPPSSLKIGYTTSTRGMFDLDPECEKAVQSVAKLCEDLGHTVEEARLEIDDAAMNRCFSVLSGAEAAAAVGVMEAMLGRALTADDFSRVNWQRIESGRSILATDLVVAVETLRQIGRHVASQCAAYDMLLTPTMPCAAPPLGTFDMYGMDADPYQELVFRYVCFTIPFNISGQPAITLPVHWSQDGLPVGVQFVARRGSDALLLRLAAQIEQAHPWWHRRPPHAAPL